MNVLRFSKRRACWVLSFFLLVGQACTALAQTVLIDFGSNTSHRGLSVPNPDTKGNYWNSLQPGNFVPNLIDIQNGATTIDVGWDTPVGTDSYNGPAGPTQPAPPAFPTYASYLPLTDIDSDALGNMGGALEAAFDFAAGPSIPGFNQVRFQIQELDPTKTYDLTFFGSHKYSLDTQTVYSVYSDNTYTTQVGTASLNVQNPVDPSLHNRDTVVTISNLSPQVDNILYVQFIGSTGNEGYLNDMRIVATTPVIAGDYNGNGKVDAADYVLWRKGGPLQNEVDTPGTVNAADYTAWRARFGNPGSGSGLGAGAVVPEPGALMLIGIGLVALFALNRRR